MALTRPGVTRDCEPECPASALALVLEGVVCVVTGPGHQPLLAISGVVSQVFALSTSSHPPRQILHNFTPALLPPPPLIAPHLSPSVLRCPAGQPRERAGGSCASLHWKPIGAREFSTWSKASPKERCSVAPLGLPGVQLSELGRAGLGAGAPSISMETAACFVTIFTRTGHGEASEVVSWGAALRTSINQTTRLFKHPQPAQHSAILSTPLTQFLSLPNVIA